MHFPSYKEFIKSKPNVSYWPKVSRDMLGNIRGEQVIDIKVKTDHGVEIHSYDNLDTIRGVMHKSSIALIPLEDGSYLATSKKAALVLMRAQAHAPNATEFRLSREGYGADAYYYCTANLTSVTITPDDQVMATTKAVCRCDIRDLMTNGHTPDCPEKK